MSSGPIFAAFGTADAASAKRTILLRPQTELPRPASPLLLQVSIKKQRIRVFDANGEIASSRISTGQPGFDTPTGVFSILEKNEYHESNIYEGAPMPHMQRLTWSGIALHAGVVPGYRASHGCIRLPASFAKSLFSMTKLGARVVVAPDEVAPVPFSHPNLFKPLPAELQHTSGLRAASETTQVAANDVATGPSTNGLIEMPQLIGINPALAEAARDPDAFAVSDRPRSRGEADRMMLDKGNRLRAALKSAEAQRIAATEAAKRAVKDADAIGPQMAAAKQVLDPLKVAIETADKNLNRALSSFADFMQGGGDRQTQENKSAGKETVSAEDREAELEDAILDLRIEADAARAELARRELDFAAVQGSAAAAEATRTAALDTVRQTQAQLRTAQADLIEANKENVRRNKPIAVLVSLKTQRIYIRQGTEPLLEAPITPTQPGRRVGTHVFTAMGYASDPDVFDWRLMSAHLPASTESIDEPASKKNRRREPFLPHSADTSARMARMALETFTIPPDILETITALARPGASLIVSDRELPANENGLGTEFVVLTR
ncbi:MAG: L,D-transpeptidase family protein [Hyphomicrobium sp.]